LDALANVGLGVGRYVVDIVEIACLAGAKQCGQWQNEPRRDRIKQKAPGLSPRRVQLFDADVFADLTRRVNNKSFGKREKWLRRHRRIETRQRQSVWHPERCRKMGELKPPS
jgi:hypothetical protein